jgi:hypothetical protein
MVGSRRVGVPPSSGIRSRVGPTEGGTLTVPTPSPRGNPRDGHRSGPETRAEPAKPADSLSLTPNRYGGRRVAIPTSWPARRPAATAPLNRTRRGRPQTAGSPARRPGRPGSRSYGCGSGSATHDHQRPTPSTGQEQREKKGPHGSPPHAKSSPIIMNMCCLPNRVFHPDERLPPNLHDTE